MQKIKKKIVLSAILCLILTVLVAISVVPQIAKAETRNSNQIEYQGYSGYSGEVLHNYSKRASYSSQLPAITVLVHGQGGDSTHWSNNGGVFAYDEFSIIEQIRQNEEYTNVYVAKVQKENNECQTASASHFQHKDSNNIEYYQCNVNCARKLLLKKVKYDFDSATKTYSYDTEFVSNLENFASHNIIIFEATKGSKINNTVIYGGNESSHDVAYAELEFVIDSILADYKYVTGVIPKINLVSHSRGGIISMMYAIDHPYNVANLISMGTPYNGSLFGNIDILVAALELDDTINCPSGQDIQSVEKQKELRDNWNKMLTTYSDASINAVAIGSKTKLDFVVGLISSGKVDNYLQMEWLKKLLAGLTECTGAAIANLKKDHPMFAEMIFQCINLGLDVVELLTDEYTSSQIAAIQAVFNNCEIAYGDLVIKDDLFIDYDSQTAQGYNGIKVETRLFDKDTSDYDLTATSIVPVPHILETRDLQIIGKVLINTNFGKFNTLSLNTFSTANRVELQGNDFAKIDYTASFDGIYTINTSATRVCVIDGTGNILVETNEASSEFRAEKNKVYSIYLGSSTNKKVNFTIKLPELSNADGQLIEQNRATTFVESYTFDTIKTIQTNSHFDITVYDKDNVIATSNNGSVDVLFEANVDYYIEIYNKSASNEILAIGIKDVSDKLELDNDETTQLYGSNKYKLFTCKTAGNYTFSIAWSGSNVYPSITFYTSQLANKTAHVVINYPNIKIYKFYMNADEKIYIAFANDNATEVQATLKVKNYTSDYSWKLDGQTIENSRLLLQRNGTYSGVLTFYYNDQLLSGQISPLGDSSQYLEVNNSRVKVKNNTPLSYGDVGLQYIVWSNDGNYRNDDALAIIVAPKIDITLSTLDRDNYIINISNIDLQQFGQLAETVNIGIEIENYMKDTRTQYVMVSNSTYINNVALNYISGYFCSKTIKVRVASVSYTYNNNRVSYDKSSNPELFINTNTEVLNGYFDGGYGSSSEPYLISNETQLLNIGKTAFYDDYTESFRVTSCFKLTKNIILSQMWKPLDASFSGQFDGNSYTIQNLSIEISKSGMYGLFSVLEGTVKNLNIAVNSIKNTKTDNSDTTMVGAIAGLSYGTITDCTVLSGSITVNLYNSWVGGIVGAAQGGKIYNCKNNGTNVSGWGILGGIVGLNSLGANINYCTNEGIITYTYEKESGCAGGIAGKNIFNGKITNCTNNGTINYGGSYQWNANIRPCMAQIVGWNVDGTVSGSTCRGSCEFKNMTIGQKKYCSDKEVGRTGE